MKKQQVRAAALFLLMFLPLSLTAQGPRDIEPTDGPARDFSLALHSLATARPLSFGPVSSAFTPSIPQEPESHTLKSLSGDFLKDAGEIWTYPLHIRTRDILPITGLAVLTAFLIRNDEAIRRDILEYRTQHAWVRSVSPVITEMGSSGAWGVAAAFICVGWLANNDQALETGVLATMAMLESGALVTILKGLAGRQRPLWADGEDHWSGPVGFFKRFGSGQYGRYDSFPGGHSITAFSLATVLAMQYRETVWVPIVAYTMATGVALSRVTEGKHWLSDCVVGGVLGCVISRMVVLNHRSRYHILPAAGSVHGSPSFTLTFSFQ
ncbi:MAG: phosphatase PAP2 family protein [Candidatus Aminicenantes bacterium]|nr:phosphatase PAP2 family protein [Candidatus Aminicenantes bacterium]